MATGDVKVTEGSGKNVATYEVSEDAETKSIQRITVNSSAGTELGGASAPIQVSLANTGSNSTAVKVDGSAATQPVSGTVTANPTVPTTLQYGQSTVSVTNTAVQLSSQSVTQVIVQALKGNSTNTFVVGDSSVTTSTGFQLQPGQAVGINISNVNKLYINGTAGDGVCWMGT